MTEAEGSITTQLHDYGRQSRRHYAGKWENFLALKNLIRIPLSSPTLGGLRNPTLDPGVERSESGAGGDD